jgi:O-antigen/teichoic acid export membrane protein
MSNPIKRLAGQTAIYGVSSIVGRFLNYLLVPVYTNYFLTHEFGVVVEMYSYVVFLIVILTYGMETAFFRFSQTQKDNKDVVFSTSLFSILTTSLLFIIFTSVYSQELANLIRYPESPHYILWFGIIIGLDALVAIPFARLRAENRPFYFAAIKITGIVVNILLVLFFIVFCPWAVKNDFGTITTAVNSFYDPEMGVGYVFISNLVATSVTALLLLPVMMRTRLSFSFPLWRTMLLYALPLMLAGLAGVVNEAIDRLLLKYMLPEEIAMSHLGIYGACYRVSVLMALFIQAFRFAAEPFFFAEYGKSDSKEIYARVMKIFVFTCLFIFLGIMLFMDIVQYFIGSDFRVGLDIVPVLLMAHIFLGVYFNLSIWYKLTGQTQYGAYITMIGAVITVVLNLFLIPRFGYHGAAWVHLVSYATMTLVSFYWGQKHFPVPYDVGRLVFFTLLAMFIYFLHSLIPDFYLPVNWIISALMIASFVVVIVKTDRDVRETLQDLVKSRRSPK